MTDGPLIAHPPGPSWRTTHESTVQSFIALADPEYRDLPEVPALAGAVLLAYGRPRQQWEAPWNIRMTETQRRALMAR